MNPPPPPPFFPFGTQMWLSNHPPKQIIKQDWTDSQSLLAAWEILLECTSNLFQRNQISYTLTHVPKSIPIAKTHHKTNRVTETEQKPQPKKKSMKEVKRTKGPGEYEDCWILPIGGAGDGRGRGVGGGDGYTLSLSLSKSLRGYQTSRVMIAPDC